MINVDMAVDRGTSCLLAVIGVNQPFHFSLHLRSFMLVDSMTSAVSGKLSALCSTTETNG